MQRLDLSFRVFTANSQFRKLSMEGLQRIWHVFDVFPANAPEERRTIGAVIEPVLLLPAAGAEEASSPRSWPKVMTWIAGRLLHDRAVDGAAGLARG